MATFSLDDARAVCKKRDAWWTVFFVDPFALRLTLIVANRTSVTPNQITVAAFILGMGAAWCFLLADPWSLAAGALLYHLSFVLDCIDGKVARLKGTGTLFGSWLDFMLDRVKALCCVFSLVLGQFRVEGEDKFLFLGFGILAMYMFRYVNAPHVRKTRMNIHAMAQLSKAPAGPPADPVPEVATCPACALSAQAALGTQSPPDLIVPARPTGPTGPAGLESARPETARAPVDRPDLAHQASRANEAGFPARRSRHAWYGSLRRFLKRSRVRIHLFSGIEFEMFILIVAPAVAAVAGAEAIILIAGLAGLLLFFFEMVLIYELWLSARRCQKSLSERNPDLAASPV